MRPPAPVARLSPVNMTMRIPSCRRASSAAIVVALMGSATAITPAGRSSTATNMTVAPWRRHGSARDSSSTLATPTLATPTPAVPRPAKSAALPTATRRAPTVPVTPLPVMDVKFVTACSARPRSWADARMAAASGCSLDRSKLAPQDRTAASSKPAAGTTATTRGLPSVSVPVLSTTKVSTFSKRSRASAFLMRTPAPAPLPTPHHDGHRGRESQRAGAGDDEYRDRGDHRQPKRRGRTPDHPGDKGDEGGNEHRRDEPGGHHIREPLNGRRGCAAPRQPMCTIRDSTVSAPIFSARIVSAPVPLMVSADHRRHPRLFRPAGTRRSPSIHRPRSFPPTPIRLRARLRRAARAVDRSHALAQAVFPHRCRRRECAVRVLGAKSSSARMALPVRSRARNSNTCPSNTRTVITAAAS